MKGIFLYFLVILVVFSLCACGENSAAPTTTAAPQTSTPTQPTHRHIYQDADCTTPKTCAECGATRGEALGHDYQEGFCTRCQEPDSSYVALTEGNWITDCLSEDGSQLELVSLLFDENGTAQLQILVYRSLGQIEEDQWDQYPQDELYDYSGTPYYFTGIILKYTLSYSLDGGVITCSLPSNSATLILERASGNRLSVSFLEGDLGFENLLVGDILHSQT
jgi:hypothetical protein